MSQPKNPQRLAEVEYCINSYFYTHFAPIMKAKKDELQSAQAREIRDYNSSAAGILRSMANASNPGMIDDTMYYLQLTGKECSKTAEDYVEMVTNAIANNSAFQADLTRLAAEWREVIIADVGRTRYDDISAQLGTDLALAYIDYRVEQMIIDKMVSDQMPKSTAEYIIRKGAENSLLGLPYAALKSPLQAEIDAQGEAAFNPSKGAKIGARGVSLVSDIVACGGVYSWGALGRWIGTEVVFAGLDAYLDAKQKSQKGLTVEQCISSALWGTTTNQFQAARKDIWHFKPYEHPYLHTVNAKLSKRLPFTTQKQSWEFDWSNPFGIFIGTSSSLGANFSPFNFGAKYTPFNVSSTGNSGTRTYNGQEIPLLIAPGKEQEYLDWKTSQSTPTAANRPNVPLVIAPGKEQEYLDWLAAHLSAQSQTISEESTPEAELEDVAEPEIDNLMEDPQTEEPIEEQPTNQQGWAGLLSEIGFDGLGDIGHNLGYVLAMLPDMLFGCFDGSTKSLGIKDNMLPMASILAGVFIKNPVLKWLMIGFGGANLLNKVGHEALERRNAEQIQSRYKQYSDEPLNPRLSNPAISGNMLVVTIDRVPCSIGLPATVIDAYNEGALPMNALANAVLARHDQQQALAQQNYREADLATDRTRQLNR